MQTSTMSLDGVEALRALVGRVRLVLAPAPAAACLLRLLAARRAGLLDDGVLTAPERLAAGPAVLRDPAFVAALDALASADALAGTLRRVAALDLSPAAVSEADLLERYRLVAEAAGPDAAGHRALVDFLAALRDEAPLLESPLLSLAVDRDTTLCHAMAHNHVPLARSVAIANTGDAPLEDLELSIRLRPVGETLTLAVPHLAPGATAVVDPVDVPVPSAWLQGLETRETAWLQVDVLRGGLVAARDTTRIDVLPAAAWNRVSLHPDLLAAFVRPDDAAVAEILESAARILAEGGGDPQWDAYDSGSRERVRAMVDAVFRALQQLEIAYAANPASFEAAGERVRDPAAVLRERAANCVDLTLLQCACLERIGLRPLVVLLRRHAFPACWLVDDGGSAPEDAAAVRALAQSGALLAFDSSSVTASPRKTLRDAETAALGFLEDDEPFDRVVDLHAARGHGIAALPAGPAEPPAAPLRVRRSLARVETWKARLLDLSLRNRLLHFVPEQVRTIPLEIADVARLEDRLAEGARLDLIAPGETDPEAIPTGLADADLRQRAVAIARAARTGLEEGGANTLYVALGLLRWYEAETDTRPHLAPIVLVPVQVHRGTATTRPAISRTDDETRLNETLLEKLRKTFELDLDALRQMPLDGAGADVAAVLAALRQAIAPLPRWEVVETAHVAAFSFTKFLMWRDLDQCMDQLLANDTVRWLATLGQEGRPVPVAATAPRPSGSGLETREMPRMSADDLLASGAATAALDRLVAPRELFLITDADSSQLAAVVAAAAGRSFALQGPPGTGKSQTITNLIAQCLALGKRVLFVSEKKAALDVVARRLRGGGLGDAMLELHSNKTLKREVVRELARILERPPLEPPGGAAAEVADDVARIRDHLNRYVERLHEPTPLGETQFSATARLIRHAATPAPAVAWPDVLRTPRALHQERLQRLERLAFAARASGTFTANPFRPCRLREWTPLLAGQVELALEALQAAAAELAQAGHTVSEMLRLMEDGDVGLLERLLPLLDLLLLPDRPPSGIDISAPDLNAILARLRDLLALGRRRAEAIAALSPRWDPQLTDLDLDDALATYRASVDRLSLIRWWELRPYRAILARVCKGKLGDDHAILQDLEQALAIRDLTAALLEQEEFLARYLGALWAGMATDWNRVVASMNWLDRYRTCRQLGAFPATLVPVPPGTPGLEAARDRLLHAMDGFRAARQAADGLLHVDWASDGRLGRAADLARTVAEWRARASDLRNWARVWDAAAAACEVGLEPLARRLLDGLLEPEALVAVYERSFLESWVNHRIEANPELRRFDRPEHERQIERFRARDAELIAMGGERIGALLESDRPAGDHAEIGVLQREARKKMRHLPIRQLLARIPNLLLKLKPCLLMSPLSIAQYLPPPVYTQGVPHAGVAPFDLVVFDEASQIATHDAIGAIARGRQVIVVGDSRQLPPTAFFNAGGSEDEAVPEVESILDECAAAALPSLELAWHYRSRDESLIRFSNRHYYEGRLTTFPNAYPGAESMGLSLRAVPDGRYDGVNEAEARAVADHVLACLTDERRVRSIGIVTFNAPQQALVEDLLDAHRQAHPEIEPYFSGAVEEPVFVKNLDNVQGDERDVMLFSVVYGPDARGRVSMNFGPLNQAGGERRLNVAITRAREQLVVFSSLSPDAIDLARTHALGPRHLKSFLRLAQAGVTRVDGGPPLDESGSSDFQRAVRVRLEAAGWKADLGVGCSTFRVDVAVRDPRHAGRYLLGILCDGASYHMARTAADRERLRPDVLDALGWRLLRLWSQDWRVDPGAEAARVLAALEAALAEPPREERLWVATNRAVGPPGTAPG